MNREPDDIHAEEPEEPVNMDWLYTFADMIMLMFATFVLLYAMSTPDLRKVDSALMSVVKALGGKGDRQMTQTLERKEAEVILDQVLLRKQIAMTQQRVFEDFRAMQAQKGLEGRIGAGIENGVITLRLPGDLLFPRGEVTLTEPGRTLIEALKDFLVQHPDQTVNIRGYTDDQAPPSGSRFRDNWEVSSLQAVGVLRLMLQMGLEPGRLTSTGLADMNPLYPNSSEEYRSLNRRVEIVLEKRVTGK